MTEKAKDAFKRGTLELVANQIYDRLTISFDNTSKRLGIHNGEPIKAVTSCSTHKIDQQETDG